MATNQYIDRSRNRMFVMPNPDGRKVRMHHKLHLHLATSGAWVPRSVEWMRSLRDDDVVFPDDARIKKTTKAKK